ncbi:hypothetical protein [Archangium lansingense]|uniref:Lipoprotein LpqB beta-propeller domain-containing protein n=1 Tax=Archangium lansingense TaxID=2995310 RepID=A0ABT4ALN8_9BACT|nr:hypothetical protein [Archangium lansinium]MCY1082602.1 hypothetical protein [Archangium lansinium]
MSTLPEALRPWAAQLSLFSEDLALSLGHHVARLAAALGPLRARNELEGGEPQGYDGLSRRGSPERLLMSEWLMALEAPDEFVRRAAFGEQSFLRTAYRQPQSGRRTVALLDAGPDQLGSPRIAHLALLVVLARRAEAAGATFSWGVLQSPPKKQPFSTVDAAAIGQWLKSANAAPPLQAQLAAWREVLELGRAPEDVWLVGGARLARLPGAEDLSRVAVDEVVAPGARQLSVEVRPASRPARQVVLDLPPAPQCVRLLRDPFAAAVAAPVLDASNGAVRSIHFSADGLRLMMAYANGSVSAQVLPQSPRDTVPKPKRFLLPSGERVVATGWRRTGGLLVVTWNQARLCLGVYGTLRGRQGHVWTIPHTALVEPLRFPLTSEPPLLALSLMREGRESVLVLDSTHTLRPLLGDERSLVQPLRGVTALFERRGGLFFVDRDRQEDRGIAMPRTGCLLPNAFDGWIQTLPVEGSGEAYFGHAKDSAQKDPGPPLAVRHQPGRWWVTRDSHDEKQGVMVTVAEGLRVVGLCCWPVDTARPGLVVLGQDERTFYRVPADGVPEFLVTAPARVVTSCVSPAQPVLAWLTEKGEVCGWSFQHRALVYRSMPGGKP